MKKIAKSFLPLLILIALTSCTEKQLPLNGNIETMFVKSGIFAEQLKELNVNTNYALLEAVDGLCCLLPSSAFQHLKINYRRGKFSAESTKLPEFSNIKNLKAIWIEAPDNKLYILNGTHTEKCFTPLEIILSQCTENGRAVKNNVPAIKMQKGADNHFGDIESDSLLIVYSDGDEQIIDRTELSKINYQNTFQFAGKEIKALWSNFPTWGMKDIKGMIDKHQEDSLLVILLDSYGWKEADYSKFDYNFQPLRSVFPPRTKYNVPSAFTGCYPDSMQADNLVVNASEPEKLIIEGDIGFTIPGYRTDMTSDENNDGNIDEEVFRKAMLNIERKQLFVHFHSVDDFGHKYGAFSSERQQQIDLVWSYIEKLRNARSGKVLLFSDHGMHTENGKGVHYQCSLDDFLAVHAWLK